jgi:hypothetical protein
MERGYPPTRLSASPGQKLVGMGGPQVNPPAGLDAAARAAWRRAVAALGVEADYFQDALARYAGAVDVADRARRQWAAEGRPLVARNPNGSDGIGVLLRSLWMRSVPRQLTVPRWALIR